MAEETKDETKKSSPLMQIITSAAAALLVAGSAPWWFTAIQGKSKADPQPTPVIHDQAPASVPQASPQASAVVPTQPASSPAPAAADMATREFFVGHWEAEQTIDGITTEGKIDYYPNGRYSGMQTRIGGYLAQRVPLSGSWNFTPLSEKTFRLDLQQDTGPFVSGRFKVLDHDHVQNLDQNYVADRVE